MIELTADRVRVTGPKVDGGYAVTFEAGEYEQGNVARLLAVPQGAAIKLVVTWEA